MRYILMAAAICFPAIASANDGTSFEQAVYDWRAANWTCESGKNHDGDDVDLKTVKEACVSMGVLTAKLSEAGYCYDAKTVEWAPCK